MVRLCAWLVLSLKWEKSEEQVKSLNSEVKRKRGNERLQNWTMDYTRQWINVDYYFSANSFHPELCNTCKCTIKSEHVQWEDGWNFVSRSRKLRLVHSVPGGSGNETEMPSWHFIRLESLLLLRSAHSRLWVEKAAESVECANSAEAKLPGRNAHDIWVASQRKQNFVGKTKRKRLRMSLWRFAETCITEQWLRTQTTVVLTSNVSKICDSTENVQAVSFMKPEPAFAWAILRSTVGPEAFCRQPTK